jgi:hypothetical protein
MYIDPNTGGVIFQVLAVLFGVFSTIILVFSGKIRIALAKLRRQFRERAKPEIDTSISDIETPSSGA